MKLRSISVVRVVEAPFDATHSYGDLLDNPAWYKCTQGDHWWFWSSETSTWMFVGHNKPHWIEPIPPEET